ncbi:MAG: c-type cytochrome [Acidiphilium sp.]
MTNRFRHRLAATALTVAIGAIAIGGTVGIGIAAAPPEVASCAGCHGANGMGNPAAGFPALAGLHAGYLEQQLYAFKHGTRANAMMNAMGASLNAATRAKIAAYYASLPVPPVAEPDPAPSGLGAQIAMQGLNTDTPHAVPACASCHGDAGLGQGRFPRLAGQSAAYLSAQLVAWQKGTRGETPLHLMRHIARKLTPADITAVTAYYAALSPNPAPGAPAAASPAAPPAPNAKTGAKNPG